MLEKTISHIQSIYARYAIHKFEKKYKQFIDQKIHTDFIPNQYLYFDSVYKIKNFGNESIEYLKRIAHEDIVVPIKVYAGFTYKDINESLRNGVEMEYWKEFPSIIASQIEKFQLKENIVVVRRVSNKFLKGYLLENKPIFKGREIIDKGFMSTSINLFYRKDYNGSGNLDLLNFTYMIIKVPKGVQAMYLECEKTAMNREEYELLLQCETKLIIEEYHKVCSNYIILCSVIV